ncbi:hypothetical protein [Rubripirellula obstinata]|nr:hypothetical protein [Rubripirellula obstinata]
MQKLKAKKASEATRRLFFLDMDRGMESVLGKTEKANGVMDQQW